MKPLVASIQASRRGARKLVRGSCSICRGSTSARLQPRRSDVPLGAAVLRGSRPISCRRPPAAASRCASSRRVARGFATRCCSSGSCATSSPTRCAIREAAASSLGARRRGAGVRIDVIDSGIGIAAADRDADLRRVRADRQRRAARRRSRDGPWACDRPPLVRFAGPPAGARFDVRARIAVFGDGAASRRAPPSRRNHADAR